MNIKGIIFDNDGTLVDSERVASGLLHRMLAEQGVALTADQVLERFRGVQFALFMADVALQAPQLDIDRFVSEFRAASLQLFRSGLAPMPGALEFVGQLALPSCVASNGPRDKIETTLKAAGLLPWFENRIVSAYEVNSWKPAPGLILAACRRLDLQASQCLLVEDSHAGVQAGLAAGTQVVGYGIDTDFSAYEGQPGFHRALHYRDLAALLASSAR